MITVSNSLKVLWRNANTRPVLKLDMEIALIWMRPITGVTALYALNRYMGFAYAIHDKFNDTLQSSLPRLLSHPSFILMLRIFALYNNSKKILAFLITLLLAEQAVIITIMIWLYRRWGEYTYEVFIISGIRTCTVSFSADAEWTIPTGNAVMIAFESILFALVMFRFFCQVRSARQGWQTLWDWKSVFANIIRGNLIYYLVVLVAASLDALGLYMDNIDPASASMKAYTVIDLIIGYYVYTMLGPHLILSLRLNHAQQLDSFNSQAAGSLSEVQFRGRSGGESVA
ncbi:hypothetical protein CONPUDRAFT_68749 [Coniophora puteana RWD-64-598 SS2]|uniref:DUF6533 domain-containing protein n=1 Tax=Coniophora puteana (strain RWD-64-598) TaxID=741705 RepID=A0A5M3N400_CONPW|nr:uncharacterized protein CONPUDRAFT_68749 [Coniophora puteana RWD-64-598 SS2]EIW86150.1 hypothetical protein CONPUDRAFT_68749 [Coniophora puteana RWD-64-598 SS2]